MNPKGVFANMGITKVETYEAMLPISPVLIRNIIIPLFNTADKSFLHFAQKYKLIETLRFIIVTLYIFFIRFVPSFLFNLNSVLFSTPKYDVVKFNNPNKHVYDTRGPPNDTGIGRALSQILWSLNDIPVSSRKYELIRSLAERIIDDNHAEGVPSLREVNRLALSAAFARALGRLEEVAAEQGEVEGEFSGVRKVMKAVRTLGMRVGGGVGGETVSAEKIAAELMWLAQKMAGCGCVEEAVWRWAAASHLGWLSLTADPRLQISLVKLSAFLIREIKDIGLGEIDESKVRLHMLVKLKMVQSWLPLLCRASNGTDAPVLSISERRELERVLEGIIERLEPEEQEQVLSLWLHHFTHCPSSDWPNLHASFARWCSASRKQLLLE